jgi:hypothetical protein
MEKGIENKGWAQKLVIGVGSDGGEWGEVGFKKSKRKGAN